MKTIAILLSIALAFLAVPTGSLAQSNAEKKGIEKVFPKRTAPEGSQLSTVSRGLMNVAGTVVLDASAYSATALTSAATIAWAPTAGIRTSTLTPAHSATINATTTNANALAPYRFVITTSGTTSYTITFGTNFKSNGTLVTGTTTAIVYVVEFAYDGTNFNEISRTRCASRSITLASAGTIALGSAEGATVYTLTPGEAATINAAVVQRAGAEFTLVVTTSGTNSYNLTFGTGFKSTGVLATGTSDAKIFTVRFISDGTNYNEVARTTAM